MSESKDQKYGFESRLTEKTAGKVSLEDIKPLFNEALMYLDNTTEYYTKDVKDALIMIRNTPYRLMDDPDSVADNILEGDTNEFCKLCHEVSQYLMQKEFPRIAVKIAQSLQGRLDTIGVADQSAFQSQVIMYRLFDVFLLYVSAYPTNVTPFCRSICKEGIINVLQRSLLYFDDPGNKIHDKPDFTRETKNHILLILCNMIIECPDYRNKYRDANLIDTLSKVRKTQVEVKTVSLLILAHIVDEQENEMLLRSQDSIRFLTDLFAKAVASPKYIVEVSGDGDEMYVCPARNLLDGIKYLAISDVNKQEILKCGGVQAIVKMLQPEFSEDERQLATDTLWNLMFDDNIKKDPEVQKAITSKDTFLYVIVM